MFYPRRMRLSGVLAHAVLGAAAMADSNPSLAPAAHPPVLADATSAAVLALAALPPVFAEAGAAALLAP